MSLIHQMLRDLDARRVPLAATQASALRGMGLLPARRTGNGVLRHLLPVIALIVAGALVAFTLRLLLSPATTGPETMPPVQAAPAGMPLAQAVMSARAETVLAGPPPATDSITTPAQHPSPALQGKTRTAR
ncbi:MAG TPA: hypothetical protein ENJ79_03250, partial [Gammaproteobacteria bacterium]|nr:hypothetical protein [Gammaproteobacteria bacterium]